MRPKSGVLVINKPAGITSHDVVDHVRCVTGEKCVGHTGTLDPDATGVLVILVGRQATRLSNKLRDQEKEYLVKMLFGISTDTLDSEGEIAQKLQVLSPELQTLRRQDVEATLEKFRGKYNQVVPIYSAVKINGVKLYQIARGHKRPPKNFVVPSREVEIKKLKLIDFQPATPVEYPIAKLRAVVSSGTYTRALVRDIGEALKIPTHQTMLVRTRAGKFKLQQAQELAEVSRDAIMALV